MERFWDYGQYRCASAIWGKISIAPSTISRTTVMILSQLKLALCTIYLKPLVSAQPALLGGFCSAPYWGI